MTSEKRWFAVRVQARFEKSAELLLRGKDYETFLPLFRVRRQWSDRIKELELPLFPGYLFCRFDPAGRWLSLLQTPGVLHVVGAGRVPTPIEESEISAVRALLRSGVAVHPWPFLGIGQRVRIYRGPLEGLEGIILKSKPQYRLVLSVTLLRRSVAAEIDSAWVQPVPSNFRALTSARSA